MQWENCSLIKEGTRNQARFHQSTRLHYPGNPELSGENKLVFPLTGHQPQVDMVPSACGWCSGAFSFPEPIRRNRPYLRHAIPSTKGRGKRTDGNLSQLRKLYTLNLPKQGIRPSLTMGQGRTANQLTAGREVQSTSSKESSKESKTIIIYPPSMPNAFLPTVNKSRQHQQPLGNKTDPGLKMILGR